MSEYRTFNDKLLVMELNNINNRILYEENKTTVNLLEIKKKNLEREMIYRFINSIK